MKPLFSSINQTRYKKVNAYNYGKSEDFLSTYRHGSVTQTKNTETVIYFLKPLYLTLIFPESTYTPIHHKNYEVVLKFLKH